MRLKTILNLVVLLLLTNLATAQAAAPQVSGTYSLSMTYNCQMNIVTNPLMVNRNGHLDETIGTMIMTPTTATTGKLKGTSIIVSGSMMALDGPNDMKRTVETNNGNYSVTAKTIFLPFIGGQHFDAAYSNIVGGIAYHVDFLGIDTANGNACNIRGKLVHQ